MVWSPALQSPSSLFQFPITALREIKILQLLKHENVVNLIEICRTKGTSQGLPCVDGGFSEPCWAGWWLVLELGWSGWAWASVPACDMGGQVTYLGKEFLNESGHCWGLAGKSCCSPDRLCLCHRSECCLCWEAPFWEALMNQHWWDWSRGSSAWSCLSWLVCDGFWHLWANDTAPAEAHQHLFLWVT